MGEKEILLKINEIVRQVQDGELTDALAINWIATIMPNDQKIKEYFRF